MAGELPSSRPIRVLALSKGLGRGGAERLVVDTARCMDPSRAEVEVAYVLPWKDALVPELVASEIPVHLLSPRRRPLASWPLQLRRLVVRGAFDVVHTHNPHTATIARLALLGTPAALVHTEHNQWDRYRTATRAGNALTYRRNAAVIAVSDAVARSAGAPRRTPQLRVVHHGPDLSRCRGGAAARREARRLLGLPGSSLVVGTVGNFTAKKDQIGLLEAFAATSASRSGARLVLVGSGPLEPALRAAATRLGLSPSMVFTGSRDDVHAILPGFDVFALPSRYEGLPMALLEAMACGIPCVVSRVGGIPEVAGDHTGCALVSPGDRVALAAALDRLLASQPLRSALGERAGAAPLPDLMAAIGRIHEVYDLVRADATHRRTPVVAGVER